MRTKDLQREQATAMDGLTEVQVDWLLRLGVGKLGWIRAGGLGVERVVAFDDGFFLPAQGDAVEADWPEAFNAVVMGVWADLVEPASEAVWDGLPSLIDRVAWDPRDPSMFWRRAGHATWLGGWWTDDDGLSQLHDQTSASVRLCATPIDWLTVLDGWTPGQPGPVCLLEPAVGLAVSGRKVETGGPYLRDLLRSVVRVVVDDTTQAETVYKALRRRPPSARLPEVFVNNSGPEDESRDETNSQK